jgi:hypothetical protein
MTALRRKKENVEKTILFIVLALFMINASCGSRGGSDSSSSGSTAVTIRLGQTGPSANSIAGALNSSAVPTGITSIRVTVSASDMVTIIKEVSVAGQSSVTITLDIPNGPNRRILVEALSASGSVLYSGESVVNLGGEPLQLTIVMSPACSLYVGPAGADGSGCTDVNNPCRTITYALAQTDADLTICVAAGTYNIAGGEDFPLALKAGISLRCMGENHTTIIDNTGEVSSPDTIIGAAGASIEGCTVRTGDNSVAISDNGTAITVNDCSILGVGIEVGAFDSTGIDLTADSTVSNSTITNFLQGEGGGEGILVSGGNPTITGTSITGNDFGVQVVGGNPTIAGNSITGNDVGVQVVGGAPVVSGNNTLSCNTFTDLENNTSNETMIDATNNMWDNDPPFEGCATGADICDSGDGAGINFVGYSLAPSPCPQPQ